MNNTQMIILIVTILGSQTGLSYYLGGRIDSLRDFLSSRIDRLDSKLDAINKALGKHEAEIENLKK